MRFGKQQIVLTILLTLLSAGVSAAVNTQYSATMCGAQRYLFGCQDLTSADGSGEYFSALGDSTVRLNLLFAPEKATAYTATIEAGQLYLFGCQVLDAEGSVANHLQQRGCECDSTVTLTLKMKAPEPKPENVTVAYEATIAEGETYLFGCKPCTAEGTYTNTLSRTGVAGDSVITLTLHVTPAPQPAEDITVAYEATIAEGETYLFGCTPYTAAGTYTNTLSRTGVAGDSTITLTLHVTPAPQPAEDIAVAYEATIKEGETYLFGCQPYTAEGTYTNTLSRTGIAGDSVVTLTLHVTPAPQPAEDITVAYEATIKEGETYLFGCQPYTAAGTYTNTLSRTGIAGDSVVTLTLHVTPAPQPAEDITVAYEATIKEGETYLFGCTPYTAEGTYTNTLSRTGIAGDSVVTLTLHVTPAPQPVEDIAVAYEATIKEGETYLFGCTPYTAEGTYTNTLSRTGVTGDSIVTLTLKVIHTTVGDTTAAHCGPFQWYEHTCAVSGDYVHTFAGANATGGDSIVTLHATIYSPVDDIVTDAGTVAGSYTWSVNGKTYTDTPEGGQDIFVKNGQNGECDTTYVLVLTITHEDECEEIKTTAPDTTVCNVFEWTEADTTVITSGTYTHVFTAANGCDSTVTIKVTVNAPKYEELPAVAKYDNRLLVIDREAINKMEGWENALDSLNELGKVEWYLMRGTVPDTSADSLVGKGYYYHNSELTPLTDTYYANVEIEPTDGSTCAHIGKTVLLVCESAVVPMPALMPSLARPGEDIELVNLDPMGETCIRVYSAEGLLQKTFTASEVESYTIQAAENAGFYLVEVLTGRTKATLRYIVK